MNELINFHYPSEIVLKHTYILHLVNVANFSMFNISRNAFNFKQTFGANVNKVYTKDISLNNYYANHINNHLLKEFYEKLCGLHVLI